jgi:hypothetical protein
MDDSSRAEAARRLGELFPAVYLALHRRDGKRRPLAAASSAVLQHLTLTGPVRVGELARHLDWQARRSPDKSREAVERETLAFMARMPAWRDHPRVRAARAGGR